MDKQETARLVRRYFPHLHNQDLLDRISAESSWVTFEADTTLLEEGDVIRVVPMVTKGVVKVFRDDEKGSSVFLYYIQAGESCAFTMNSCLRLEKSNVIEYLMNPLLTKLGFKSP